MRHRTPYEVLTPHHAKPCQLSSYVLSTALQKTVLIHMGLMPLFRLGKVYHRLKRVDVPKTILPFEHAKHCHTKIGFASLALIYIL